MVVSVSRRRGAAQEIQEVQEIQERPPSGRRTSRQPNFQTSKLPSFPSCVLPAVAGPKSARICAICGFPAACGCVCPILPSVVKGRVDGGDRPRRIARPLCVFAEKGRGQASKHPSLQTSTKPRRGVAAPGAGRSAQQVEQALQQALEGLDDHVDQRVVHRTPPFRRGPPEGRPADSAVRGIRRGVGAARPRGTGGPSVRPGPRRSAARPRRPPGRGSRRPCGCGRRGSARRRRRGTPAGCGGPRGRGSPPR